MSKQVNYNENLCAGAAIRDDKGRRISKLFEASHPKMTVGYAKNLIMPDEPTEQEFNFRQAGGGVIEDGVAVIDKVKGNSVVWNQWEVKQTAENSSEEWDVSKMFWGTNIVSGSLSFNEDSSIISYSFNDNSGFFRGHKGIGYIVGHKYVILVNAKANTSYLSLTNGDNGVNHSGSGNWELMSLFFTATTDSYTNIGLRLSGETSFPQAISQSQWKTIDLTQMFGAGNEPTTYEEFLSRKPKVADEYAYNEGTIVNNKVEGCRTVGLNQFNPNVETEYLAVTGKSGSERYVKRFKALPGTYFIKSINNESIYVKSVINGVYGSANALNRDVKITLDSYGEIWIYSETEAKINGVANDICINLSDPIINGKYFPYEEHTLDLAWVKDIKDAEGVKLFKDGMRSAGTAFDEVGKNKAVKRIAVSTFNGTEEWRINSSANDKGVMAYQCYSKFKPINENIRCDRFVTRSWSSLAPMSIFAIPKNGIIIETDGTQSLDDFKASLEAKPLDVYYELAEPIEVEYDEKNLTYPVVAGGTEEAIASEPSTAFRADIGYGIDAVKTILDLKARVEALEGK